MISTAYFFDLASPLNANTFYSHQSYPCITLITHLWLAIRDLVDPKPLVRRPDQPRQVSLDILNIVQPRSKRIVDIDDENFPVSLPLVEERHDAEYLDLLDLANIAECLAYLADVERVVVPIGSRLSVLDLRVFPGLREGAVIPYVA